MKIKVGDTVIVTTGSRTYRNKTGKVLKTFADQSLVLVEGVNLKKKVTRDANGKKSLVDVEFPIHVSNVMIFDEASKKGTRVAYEGTKKDKKRITKKSGITLK